MKTFLIWTIAAIITHSAGAQTQGAKHTANDAAAGWKTWLVEDDKKPKIAPPPNAAITKRELQQLKQQMAGVNEVRRSAIKYWNAGAPAYRWNQILPAFIHQKPDVQLRMPGAWVNLAIYDATVLAWKEKVKYKRQRPALIDASLRTLIEGPSSYAYPCEHAVTAAAAAQVMAYFFPAKADSIIALARSAAQSRIDAGVQFPSDIEAGWMLGEQVGKQVVEKAKADGSAKKWDGQMNKDPKKWTGAYPLGITLATFTPLTLRSQDQFRVPPPPDFAQDMKELKDFKPTFQSVALAYQWANSGNSWSELAAQKMFEYRLSDDAPTVARIYAVLNTAYHDAAIAIMDSKYAYWGVRPDQYDSTYKPLIGTPPFPGYPSGHAAGAATSSAVLSYFFPADSKEFDRLAQQCADSRFWAGIHFRTDNEAGLQMGKAIGRYVVQTWMSR